MKKKLKRLPLIANPPLAVDLVSFVAPLFASFVATKTLTRGVPKFAVKYVKSPTLQKHLPVVTSAAVFAAAYYGAPRVSKLEAYHTPIVIGSAVAFVQTALHTYLPALRWLISDAVQPTAALGASPHPRMMKARKQQRTIVSEEPVDWGTNTNSEPTATTPNLPDEDDLSDLTNLNSEASLNAPSELWSNFQSDAAFDDMSS